MRITNSFLVCTEELGRMISIEYMPLFSGKAQGEEAQKGKKTGEKGKERKSIEIIGNISTRRSTKERSVETGEIMRTEIKTKNKSWDRTLRRIINMSIEN